MTAFEELPEDVILAALEGHECILGSFDEQERAKAQGRSCPECGGSPQPVLNQHDPFHSAIPAFRYISRCSTCGCHFDPDSGIIRKPGAGNLLLTAARSKS